MKIHNRKKTLDASKAQFAPKLNGAGGGDVVSTRTAAGARW
jgi:hypothetical protein